MSRTTSPPASYIVAGGRVLDPQSGRDELADILIANGRIEGLAPDISRHHPALERVDAGGLLLAPGFVDLHTHLRTPGQSHKETVATGTAAAAAGGFTTIVQMPNTLPPPDSAAGVEAASEHATVEGLVRVLPSGVITSGRAGQTVAPISELAAAGAVTVSDDGDFVADTALMRTAYEAAQVAGIPISQHCEVPELVGTGSADLGQVSRKLGVQGRPAAAEEAAVARDIALAALTGGQAHIQHLSSAGAVELVRTARRRGIPVTAEVTPHHLVLTAEALLRPRDGHPYDTLAKCNPPLRTSGDRAALIAGLADGTIQAIATDHAPHTLAEKQTTLDDAPPGMIGLETALAATLALVNSGKLDLMTLVGALTIGPVRAWRLDQRPGLSGLGTLAVGAPADVAVVDLEAGWTVTREALRSRSANTPFLGTRFTGRVVATIAGGRLVHDIRNSAGGSEPL